MDFITNNEGMVKIRTDAVGGDLDRIAFKYPTSFMNEMARQLTSAIESATGVEGIADSSVELIMMFASSTYMEHVSDNVTYRRLMLIDAVSAPRDFWVKWTRLEATDGEYNEGNILFELGEDVDQKIREREYRYLLTAGKDKYHNSMGRKKVTEWRDVIKRAAKRGELTKVESDFELAPETLELEERIADLLGKRIEARTQPAKEEVPYITPENDEFARAMEKARLVVEAAVEEAEEPTLEEIADEISEAEAEEIPEEPIEAFPVGEGGPLAVDEVVEEPIIEEEPVGASIARPIEEPIIEEPIAEEEPVSESDEMITDTPDAVEHNGDSFLRFKKRLWQIRAIMMALIGAAAGLFFAGLWLILTKLAVIDAEPLLAIAVGLGAALLAAATVMLITRKSDKTFAEELDESFGLKARVQTMIAYKGESGDILSLQRDDAERALESVPLNSYKFKRIWIYVVALVLAATILTTGIVVKDMRDYVPPEEVEAFVLSDLQREGLNELIRYVERSDMEEEFRTPIAEELRSLLAELELIDTVPDMQAALGKTMAIICDITYESSTATEMLNALWDSDDIYLRYLAKTLDTSSWTAPDWGDFAEKVTEYSLILMGDNNEDEDALHGKASLKWALESITLKLDNALLSSGLDESDEIYAAITHLFDANPGGLRVILAAIDYHDDNSARDALNQSLNLNSKALYDAISLNKVNASTGEYAMTRLAGLFLVPVPEFERPEFVKNGESVEGGQGGVNDKEDENGTGDGGIGEGATYGSDDLVLDPISGKYVKYSELIDTYYAKMNEKLNSGAYTEEQQEAIRKYFDLLYGGLEKKEEGK